jgi:RHS repeat-associated protein
VVASSGDLDGTTVFYYDGQGIVETRDGSGNLVSQFVRGLRYIDEVVMVRAKDEGELYVHQDANWNVVGLTDLGGRLVERYVYRPYGEVTVHQLGGYADYDGDGDVDANDRGEITGLTCGGSNPSGACRVLDLDFDNDCDASDETVFDALPHTGTVVHPARRSSLLGQPFAHQGLFLDPQIGSYQNRARQYDPHLRRFVQRDPLALIPRTAGGFQDGLNLFEIVRSSPVRNVDPRGLDMIPLVPTPRDRDPLQPPILPVPGTNPLPGPLPPGPSIQEIACQEIFERAVEECIQPRTGDPIEDLWRDSEERKCIADAEQFFLCCLFPDHPRCRPSRNQGGCSDPDGPCYASP